jgi:2',5'-phosphodiesterase
MEMLRGRHRSHTRPIALSLVLVGGVCGVAVANGDDAFNQTAETKGVDTIRVATYNILSDKLSRHSHFSHCAPEDCDPETRLLRIKEKLRMEMDQNSIICLQEVSRHWSAELVPFLDENDYQYAVGCSGGQFNGYMGQCLAWPRGKFKVEAVDVTRISDTVEWPKKIAPPPAAAESSSRDVVQGELYAMERLKDYLRVYVKETTSLFNDLVSGPQEKVQSPTEEKPKRPPFDVWDTTKSRHNCIVMARLRDRETGSKFVIGTYHMPCLFGSDAKCQVMVAHCALLMRHAQQWAKGDPLLVTGDFNIKPFDPAYKFISDGELDPDHMQHPPSGT